MTDIEVAALSGVPETLLWTLRNRAVESARSDSSYTDPMAEDLFRRIRHGYGFGRPSQSHALRAMAFDDVTRRFLAEHPSGTVVALGEGLQTSFWRIGDDGVRWLSVDVEEAVALRRRLLPAAPNLTPLACSALDRAWMDRVDPADGVLVTAEGLLMYFAPADVRALIADCAARFPGAWMLFDSIPHWFSRRTLKGLRLSRSYTAPPMPFALDVGDALALADEIPGVRRATEVALPPGRGLWGNPLVRALGTRVRRRPSITLLEFA
jgi:O-methyltransferase involved in polyketide biosynthesis